MADHAPGIRRACIAVDVEREGGAGDPARPFLTGVLTSAAELCGLDRMLIAAGDTGHGEIAVLPAGIDEPRALAALIEELGSVLRHLNTGRPAGARLRLRVAIHEGVVSLTVDGFTGRALAAADRLVRSQPLRSAMTRHRRADLAVLVSDRVFEGLGQHEQPGLSASEFRRVDVADQGTGLPDGVAWLYVPVSDAQPDQLCAKKNTVKLTEPSGPNDQ